MMIVIFRTGIHLDDPQETGNSRMASCKAQ